MSDQTTAGPPESWWRMTTARKLEIKALIAHVYAETWPDDADDCLSDALDHAWDESIEAGEHELGILCEKAYEDLTTA